MDVEFKALTTNHTWTLVPFQGQNNIRDSKWVFKTKYKADGVKTPASVPGRASSNR